MSRSFQEREKTLGDIAESAFEQWAETKEIEIERYGLHRPKIKRFWMIPSLIRKTPDYLCYGKVPFFCEIKGTGQARHTKIKEEDMVEFARWNDELQLWFFIYDNYRFQVAFVDFITMLNLCKESPVGTFPDKNKVYYRIHDDHFTWESFKPKDEKHGY